MAAIRLQEFNQFSQSPGGISTWAIAGIAVGLILAGTAFRLARRRMNKPNDMFYSSTNPQTLQFQRNPLTSTRGQPTTALQTLQQERIQVQSTAVRQTFKRSPPNQMVLPSNLHSVNPIQMNRQTTMRPMSGMDPRKDLQVFQATTVRNIRQGRPNARITGVRKDHIVI